MTDSLTRGTLTLADFPDDMIRVACDRLGRYRRPSLVEQFRASAALPDVLNGLANCQRTRKASTPCGAHFPDLAGGGF
jgi:hypothetical protein